jgi:hypothetical protein
MPIQLSKEITRLHQVLIHTLEQASTTPVARLALDIVSTMHNHHQPVPVFEVPNTLSSAIGFTALTLHCAS